MYRVERLSRKGSGRYAAAPLALLFVLALPCVASARQWATNGNNINNTNTGNVGVGTTAPITIFQIRPAANVNMGFTHSGGAEAVITAFNDANTATVPIMIRGTSVKFQDGTLTERLRIGAGVAVGSGYVGLTVPTNGAIFQGNVAFGTSTADKVFTVEGQVASVGATMAVFRTTGANHGSGLALEATGAGNNNLGFLVSGVRKAAISWDNSRSFFGLLNIAYSANDFALRLNTDGSLTYHDGANGTERVRVTAAGNVGIGTDSPSGKLSISDAAAWPASNIGALYVNASNTIGAGLNLHATGTNGRNFLLISTASGAPTGGGTFGLFDATLGGAAGYRFVVNSAGNVGIGTLTPGYKLDVAGSVNASGLCIAGDCKTAWSQVGGSQWLNSGTSIYYGNYVGIGTSTPSQQLHVHGSSTWAGTRVTTAGTGATINDGVNFGYDEAYGAFIWNREATPIVFSASNAERMRMDAAGNLGIGTTAPTAKLDVAGNVAVTGNITATGNISAKYQDVAEWVASSQKLAAGTVVVLDPARTNHVVASSSAYDTKVAGVVSESPGVILGTGGEGKLMVATTGRVKVKADATRAPIRIGDLIVTSDAEGVAMKSVPVELGGVPIHRPGTIIGKALEPLEKGAGEILVLLSLQ